MKRRPPRVRQTGRSQTVLSQTERRFDREEVSLLTSFLLPCAIQNFGSIRTNLESLIFLPRKVYLARQVNLAPFNSNCKDIFG